MPRSNSSAWYERSRCAHEPLVGQLALGEEVVRRGGRRLEVEALHRADAPVGEVRQQHRRHRRAVGLEPVAVLPEGPAAAVVGVLPEPAHGGEHRLQLGPAALALGRLLPGPSGRVLALEPLVVPLGPRRARRCGSCGRTRASAPRRWPGTPRRAAGRAGRRGTRGRAEGEHRAGGPDRGTGPLGVAGQQRGHRADHLGHADAGQQEDAQEVEGQHPGVPQPGLGHDREGERRRRRPRRPAGSPAGSGRRPTRPARPRPARAATAVPARRRGSTDRGSSARGAGRSRRRAAWRCPTGASPSPCRSPTRAAAGTAAPRRRRAARPPGATVSSHLSRARPGQMTRASAVAPSAKKAGMRWQRPHSASTAAAAARFRPVRMPRDQQPEVEHAERQADREGELARHRRRHVPADDVAGAAVQDRLAVVDEEQRRDGEDRRARERQRRPAGRRPTPRSAAPTRPLTVTSLKATLYGIGSATTVAIRPGDGDRHAATVQRRHDPTRDGSPRAAGRPAARTRATLDGPSASSTTKSDGTTM